MIVKSISWKTPGFQQILEYVTHQLKMAGTPVTRNLPVRDAADIRAVQQEFEANARYLPERKNGVCLYHEILSFAPDDSAQLTLDILTDLAARYLELRAADALAYGTVHLDRGHPHIHVVISSNLIRQQQKLRLSRPQFAAVKRAIEAYQKERYPQLAHSLVQPDADEARERKRQRRRQRLTRREEGRGGALSRQTAPIRELIDQALFNSFSAAEFSRALQTAGIGLIHEQGRITGITAAGGSYAFLQLGYPANVLTQAETAWKTVAKRMRTIARDETDKTRTLLRRFGYADELLAVLQQSGRDHLSPLLRQRLATIERDADERRSEYRRTHTGLGRRKDYSED